MLIELLRRGPSFRDDKPAIVDGERTLSYRQLRDAAEAMGQYLRGCGLGTGQTVATQMHNSTASAVAVFAAGEAGATNLLLDPSLKTEEVERYCERAGAAAIMRQSSELDSVLSPRLPPLTVTPLGEQRHTEDPKGSEASIGGEHCVSLLLSSGTGGSPKIVPRTAPQAAAAFSIFSSALPYYETDRVLAALPFYHSFGLYNVLMATIAAGATLHVERFSPRETAAAIERHRITVLPATPFMFRMLTETTFQPVTDFSSVRLAVSAGSAMPKTIIRGAKDKFGIEISQSYGTTETGPIALAEYEEDAGEPGRVGALYLGVTVEIRSPSQDPLPPGLEGEIAVRSPANAPGYLDRTEASAASFRGPWVLTGDIGRMDEAGGLFVLGRKRPMVNVAGKKVAPAEVEACLRDHPSVSEARVLADKAPEGGERVKALVVPTAEVSVRSLQEFCLTRLADYKVPRRILFVKALSCETARQRAEHAPADKQG